MFVLLISDLEYGGEVHVIKAVGPFPSKKMAETHEEYKKNIWVEVLEMETP